MKKTFTILLFIAVSAIVSAQARFIENRFQIGYETYNYLTFGTAVSSTGVPVSPSTNKGNWALESWDGGLNIWRPCPTYNCANYFLFIKDDNGYVGIGKKPVYKLDVAGDIATNGVLRISSDKRFKTDIEPLKTSLSQLQLLEGISFRPVRNDTVWYKDDSQENNQFRLEKPDVTKAVGKRFGFVAQEIQKVFPELVDTDINDYLNVDYIGLIPVIVESIKEQQTQIERLKEELAAAKGNTISEAQLRSSTGENNTTGISDAFAKQCVLYQNAPNPFSEKTAIKYFLPTDIQQASVCIFDMQGKLLKKINAPAGENTLIIKGSELHAGMYFYSLIADGKEVDTKRMILTK